MEEAVEAPATSFAEKPGSMEPDTIPVTSARHARPLHYAPHSPEERDQFLVLKQSIGLPNAVWQWEAEHSTAETTLYNWSEAEDHGTQPPPGMMRRPGAGRPAAFSPETTRELVII